MMEAVRTSETSVDNHLTRQYNPEDSSEHHIRDGFFLLVQMTRREANDSHPGDRSLQHSSSQPLWSMFT
jgi:hypothetical protein